MVNAVGSMGAAGVSSSAVAAGMIMNSGRRALASASSSASAFASPPVAEVGRCAKPDATSPKTRARRDAIGMRAQGTRRDESIMAERGGQPTTQPILDGKPFAASTLTAMPGIVRFGRKPGVWREL